MRAWLKIAGVGIIVAFGACRSPQPPAAPADDLEALALVVDQIERAEPAARLGCTLLPEPERGYCDGGLDGLREVVVVGRPLLETARACRSRADLECLDNARATAGELLRKARSLRGESTAPAAPAPLGSP